MALVAVPSARAALDLFARVRRHDPGALAAFEYMSGGSMDLVLEHVPGATLPLSERAPAYALIELSSPAANAGLRAALEAVLEAALEAGEATDAVLAESEAQRAALWRLREEHSEGQRLAGATVKNDVSVPVSRVPEFLARATAACEALVPGIRAVPFGHVGDGNIHFNLLAPEGAEAGRVPGPGRGHPARGGRGGARAGRQLFRRARRGAAEGAHAGRLARRDRAGRDAADQGGARPAWPDEPGETAAVPAPQGIR